MSRWVAAAAVLAVSMSFVACKKKVAATDAGAPGVAAPGVPTPKPTPTPAPTPAPAPAPALQLGGDILGRGAVGGIDDFVAALEPYLSAFQESALTTAAVKAQIGKWIGLESWDGVDGQKPARVWLVNPKKFRPPFVVALPLLAGKKAAVKGWASEEIAGHAVLAKDAATIAAVRAALTAQLGAPAGVPGGRVAFAVDIPEVLNVYAPEIEKLLSKATRKIGGADAPIGGESKKFLKWLVSAALELARQVSRIEAEVTVAKDHARVSLRLAPIAGTALAEFLAAPKQPFPTNISKAPGDVSIAAVLAYSPDALKKVFERIAASMDAAGPDKPAEFVDFFRKGVASLLGSLRGDLVYAKRLSGATTALIGAADGEKGLTALRELYTRASKLMQGDTGPHAIKSKFELTKGAGSYKGVKYDRLRVEFDYSKLRDFERKLLEQIQGKGQDTFLAAKGDLVLMAGSNKRTEKPIQDALDTLSAPAAGKSLGDKAEFKALLSQVPASRFGVLYLSFVDYVKGVIMALASAGGAAGGDKLGELKSEGYIGAALSVEGGALQLDAIATRSHIESIKNFFKMMRPSSK